jgi:hypothetical protein
MARYKDGLKVATHVFEAAAWHHNLKVTCGSCGHHAVFDPHKLWWLFTRKGWDDRLTDASRRFWCRQCGARVGKRIKAAAIELVRETAQDHGLPFPPEAEWKRAVNRIRS